jgi:hypothetical protein
VNTANDLTAFGWHAAFASTGTVNTTAFGAGALQSLNGGTGGNAAFGASALNFCTTGSQNTAFGTSSLQANTTAGNNTGVGQGTLYANQTGEFNALSNSLNQGANTAVGYEAGGVPAHPSVNGQYDTFIGYQAGSGSNDTSFGVAIGAQALVNGISAIAIGVGVQANAAGSIAIGKDSAGTPSVSNTADLAVIGTALTTVQVAKLNLSTQPAFVAADKYLVVSASGAVHVSALGPAS